MIVVQVETSSVIPAPVQQVWSIVRDFNGLPHWFPSVIDSEIEQGQSASVLGCIRCYHREDGLTLREQLLGLDDHYYCLTYSLLEPAQPMVDYVATLRLLPITDGDRTYIEWNTQFKCLPEEAESLRSHLEALFQLGFDALKEIVP